MRAVASFSLEVFFLAALPPARFVLWPPAPWLVPLAKAEYSCASSGDGGSAGLEALHSLLSCRSVDVSGLRRTSFHISRQTLCPESVRYHSCTVSCARSRPGITDPGWSFCSRLRPCESDLLLPHVHLQFVHVDNELRPELGPEDRSQHLLRELGPHRACLTSSLQVLPCRYVNYCSADECQNIEKQDGHLCAQKMLRLHNHHTSVSAGFLNKMHCVQCIFMFRRLVFDLDMPRRQRKTAHHHGARRALSSMYYSIVGTDAFLYF